MEGQESASGLLPEALEFEGRFVSSCPVTDNPFWWHHEQSSLELQLPDFIPIPIDGGASHHSGVTQARWNAERLNIDQSSSSSIQYGSGDSRKREFVSTYSGVSSGSNNPPYQHMVGTYQGNSNGSSADVGINNLNQPVVVESSMNEFITKDLLTNVVTSGHAPANEIATVTSSAHTPMNFLQTGIIFKEENNRPATASGVIISHSPDKRKSPEGYQDESSSMASKRSGQIAGSGGSHAATSSHIPLDISMTSSSANIYGLESLGTLSSGTPSPRSSFFEVPFQQETTRSNQNIGQSSRIRTNTSLQGLVPTDFLLPGTIVSQNSDYIVQLPSLVTPPSQTVGEGSNFQNQSMTAQSPATLQQGVHFAVRQSGSRNIGRNSSRSEFTPGNAQIEGIGFRNSTQNLRLPVIAPSVGTSNLAHIAMNFGTPGGDASIDLNSNLGAPSDPNPNVPVPTPDVISNSYRRRRLELIRRALLEVVSFSEDSTISHPGPGVHLGMTPERRQRLVSRKLKRSGEFTLLDGPSQARHLITMYRGGRDLSLLEDGVNARESIVSAFASIRDQHRDMRLDVDNMGYEELLELGERIGDVKTGLSEETIMDSLTFTMKSDTPHAEPCSICQEEYSEGDDLGTLDCGHEYHTNCIKQWLVLKNSCPICKAAASS